jgi:hypothetical protein
MKRNFALYALSTLLVLTAITVLSSLGLSSQFLTAYVPLAFFAVAGLDFYRTQVLEGGASEARVYARVSPQPWGAYGNDCGHSRHVGINRSESTTVTARSGSSFADRFLAYLFVAPFIFPAMVYERLTSR